MDWFRSHHGAPSDAKLTLIAMRSGQHRAFVTAVWWEVLDHASQQLSRGCVEGIDAEIIAVKQSLEVEQVEAILAALTAKKIIVGNRLVNWDKRQPAREDSSRDRMREHRAKKRDVTHGDASVTHGDAPEEREIRGDTEEEKKGEGYYFDDAPIRLTRKDYDRWKDAYWAIPDIKADLHSIAAKFRSAPPPNWFERAGAWLNKAHQQEISRNPNKKRPTAPKSNVRTL